MKKMNIFIYLLIVMLTSYLEGCIPAPPVNRRTSTIGSNSTTSTNNGQTNLPTFSDGNNYFQNGGTVYTANFSLVITFSDSYYFRGKDVDNYIRTFNPSQVICQAFRFPTESKILLLALTPRSVYNTTNQSLEYYYSTFPNDKTTNQNFCQKSGLLNTLFTLYPGLTPLYAISSLCSGINCSPTGYTSQPLLLYTNAGGAISNIKTTDLQLQITNPILTSSPTSTTCTTSTECKVLGYDCCSGNQCVKDLQKKTGFLDTAPGYVQALQDILNNPSAIYNYPQYYYLCSTNVNLPPPSTTPSTIQTTTADAVKRLNTLASLYNCINKVHGEAGVCTSTYPQIVAGGIYFAHNGDRNFQSTLSNINASSNTLSSIEKITIGEVTVFDIAQDSLTDDLLSQNIYSNNYVIINGLHNDDLNTGASITIKALPPGTISNEMIIYYRNDASCVLVNPTLAKCEKYYTQGQSNYGTTILDHRRGRVTDHYPASNNFLLPSYADLSRIIKVELDGVSLLQDTDWSLPNSGSKVINMIPTSSTGLRVFDSQKVKITFYAAASVMEAKRTALLEVQSRCHCADTNCNISPIKDQTGNITDYACVYPLNNPVIPPISQTAYLSAKAVPMRYYDTAGVAQDTVTLANLPQEGALFTYTNNNLSQPNNISTYIGFNEIYGNLSYQSNSAKPPLAINVKKGSSYDIYVNNGQYYSCASCGADYYSQINKLFPSFQYAGGLVPAATQTDRFVSNSTMARADEFHFGRACFIPATMIPWSHAPDPDVRTQRNNRLRQQHFLFANGYNRDWFGFDYGAVIGSFDGVQWFAIGTNRRIKATSNKLFIAINGYTGDLTIDASYLISINDAILNPNPVNLSMSDDTNDGAECRQHHICNNDNDCYAHLGPEYVCANPTDIKTTWPTFDDNAQEMADKTSDNNQLISILNSGSTGKRCVYRGRGAICSLTDANTCNANNACQSIQSGGTLYPKFNNRIWRAGMKIADATKDTYGVGTPVLLRPYSYIGGETARTENLHNLNANQIRGLCLPTVDNADRVVGIGRTDLTTGQSMYNTCGVFDTTGNYYQANSINTDDALSQFLSTDHLKIFNTIYNNLGLPFDLITKASNPVNAKTFLPNSCLKAPGAICETDLECAPSKVIADKLRTINSTSVAPTLLNSYEIKFWQEGLICSQSMSKTDPAYNLNANKCCRDVGNVITIGQTTTSSQLQSKLSLTNLADPNRYSRWATINKELQDSTNYPILEIPVSSYQKDNLLFQYKTLSLLGQKTSCSNAWVRNFANGDHIWGPGRLAKIPAAMFTCINWYPLPLGSTQTQNSCIGLNEGDPNCTLAQTTPSSPKAQGILKFMGKLLLLGVPQIAIPNEAYYTSSASTDLLCNNSNSSMVPTGIYLTPPSPAPEITDGTNYFYSGKGNSGFNPTNFKVNFKTDEITACLPAGTAVDLASDYQKCCTGFVNQKTMRCALPDFTDVSVYTNRYISSEAMGLAESLFNEDGYLNDPSYGAQLACQKNMCASGTLAYGVLISNLKIPGLEATSSTKKYRFLQDYPAADDLSGLLTLFKQGLQLNNHVYCVPANAASAGTSDLTVVNCNGN